MNLTIYGLAAAAPSTFASAVTEVRGELGAYAGPQVVASCTGRAGSFYMVSCRGAVLKNGEWNVLHRNFCVSPGALSLYGPSALSDVCTASMVTGDFVLSLHNPASTVSPYMLRIEVLPVHGPAPVVSTPAVR